MIVSFFLVSPHKFCFQKPYFYQIDSGTVDFEEFIGMMSKFRQAKTSTELEEELKEIFNVGHLDLIKKYVLQS
jgi:hypothetical protein